MDCFLGLDFIEVIILIRYNYGVVSMELATFLAGYLYFATVF